MQPFNLSLASAVATLSEAVKIVGDLPNVLAVKWERITAAERDALWRDVEEDLAGGKDVFQL